MEKTHAAGSYLSISTKTSLSGSCPSSKSSSSSPLCSFASPKAAWTRTVASLSLARSSRLDRRVTYRSSLLVNPAFQAPNFAYSISPRPLIIDTVNNVTRNRTFLSFASMPDKRCLRSLSTKRDEAVSTSSPSGRLAASSTRQLASVGIGMKTHLAPPCTIRIARRI